MTVYHVYTIYQEEPWTFSDAAIFEHLVDARNYANDLLHDLLSTGFTPDLGFEDDITYNGKDFGVKDFGEDEFAKYLIDEEGNGARIFIDEYELQ